MPRRRWLLITLSALLMFALSVSFTAAQTSNASIDGAVNDANGAAIQGAAVKLTNKGTGAIANFITGSDGLFSFPNVIPGTYQLSVSAKGFQSYLQEGILVRLGYPIRQDVILKVGAVNEEVRVTADASPLNYDNAEVRGSIDPQVIQDVPLLVAGSIRSAGNFASLLPGVARGSGDVTGAHVNGSQSQTGVTILDGISLFNSSGIQGLTGAVLDFPQSPDVISEFQVLTSNYSPKYGGSAAGVTVENVRSGTNSFHGTAYEFNRNNAFNAIPWGTPASTPRQDVENDFGGNFGGPAKIPGLWGLNHQTFFFANFEAFRVRGGVNTAGALSLPSASEQQGDFRDWTDSSGNLIPIYDPATNPRQQFMGCDGHTPNVICSTDPRLKNSLAAQWFKYLPTLSNSQAQSNYIPPPQPVFLGTDAYSIVEKVDENIGSRDHFSEMFFYKRLPRTSYSRLPPQISFDGTSYKRTSVWRVNWDHTFSPYLVNHFGFGYQNDKYYGGGIDGNYAKDLPQIPGVASHAYPPQITFSQGFATFGTGAGDPNIQPWLAPAYLVNDVVSMTRGKHVISIGGDFRTARDNPIFLTGESGSFGFSQLETGLPGVADSGSPIASFLLEQVDSASVTYRSTTVIDAHTKSFAVFAGDTWKTTSKLTLDLGLRYEIDPPTVEANDQFSYFDRNLPNPGAGNLLGAVAFAGSGTGRSGIRHPEDTWYGAIAPRVGLAYAIRRDTVIRSGYGMFYDSAYMPGYDGGITQDGYNFNATYGAGPQGITPAFILNQGIPATPAIPQLPLLSSTIDNGVSAPIYRPKRANRLPYAQQWNLTVEHEFSPKTYVSVSYVGNKGTRLISGLFPLNVLNPSLLSSGQSLFDSFVPGGPTVVDGVPEPFPNFASVMTGCAATVAQALLPYPQYCNSLVGRNENSGDSRYHSLQVKAEHRLSQGLWVLLTYTNSKLLTDADNNQGPGEQGIVSPYDRGRFRSLALEDIPQTLNLAYSYELPFGRGKRWLSQGVANAIAGGWTFNGVFRAQSGIPFTISNSACSGALPPQFRVQCLPALLPSAKPFTGSLNGNSLVQGQPYLNASSFETVPPFSTGTGPRVMNFRQPAYNDFDIGLQKVIHITERVTFQLRGDAFNVFNQHHFNSVGVANGAAFSSGTGGSAFNTDLGTGSFGTWNGTVTAPRNIQVSGRISF